MKLGPRPRAAGAARVGAAAGDTNSAVITEKAACDLASPLSRKRLLSFPHVQLFQQQVCLPADPFGGGAELFQSPVLDLADSLLADPQQVADLAQAVSAVTSQAEPQVQHFPLARPQVFHEEAQRLLAFGILLERGALVVGHRLGELEVAVVVEN